MATLITVPPSPIQRSKTSWEFAVGQQGLILPQTQHLEQLIEAHNFKNIYNLLAFQHWKKYQTTTTEPFDLVLYAHTDWSSLSSIVETLKQLDYSGMIFLAINKYLILPEQQVYPNFNVDYDVAIGEFIDHWFDIIDYQYNPGSQYGNVGNFVIPDNRFLLRCKN
jgi:hypothetical protein